MNTLVEKYLPIIQNCKKLKSKDRCHFIMEDEKLAKCICKICLNLIKGNIHLKSLRKLSCVDIETSSEGLLVKEKSKT